jgi:phosphatidylserine decarboxylase
MSAMPNPRAAAEWLLATASSWPLLSRLTGRVSDLRLPPALLVSLIRVYSRAFGVDLEECARPPEAYCSFNDFFTRELAEGRRPVARDPGVVVSPCDARISVVGSVPADGRLEQVKGHTYSVEALLGSASEAAPFAGGTHATLYLSPAMYHRVHSPVDGRILAWRYVAGRLFPVNGPGVRAIPGLFTRNERVCLFYESAAHGRVAVVLVGAANVGRMTLSFTDLVTNRGARAERFEAETPVAVSRGGEIGAFNLGSTVVLLLEDRKLAPVAERGALVRMGQPLWRRR